MKYLVKVEQVGYCYMEVEIPDWEKDLDDKTPREQMAMKKAEREMKMAPHKYIFIQGEAYAKDVDILDG